jgi:ketosteroid isomerase-like protein
LVISAIARDTQWDVGEEPVYRGHQGIRQFMQEVDKAFARVQIDQLEISDLGERILVSGHPHARGRASGVETESPIGWVAEFNHGRVVRMKDYLDPGEALEAAGTPE